MQKYFKYLIIALAVLVIVPQIAMAAWWNPASWGIWNKLFGKPVQAPVACTMEAKQCSDGSYVSRKGPKCEFDVCPQAIVGGDKDVHGCIGSAGYTWCQAKQKCLRTWEEKCEITNLTKLSEENIVTAVGQLEKVKFVKKNGIYKYENLTQKWGVDLNQIVTGDINGDTFEDAFVHVTVCGGSCGSEFAVVLGGLRGVVETVKVVPESFITAGAGQYHVKNIEINNRMISMVVEITDYQGSVGTDTLKYAFDGKNLIKIK
jgi:hypothetical protein